MFHYSFTTNPTISNGWSSYPAPKMVHPMLQPYPIIVGICWLYYLHHIPNYIRCINAYIIQYIPMTQWWSYPFISPISLQHDIPILNYIPWINSHVINHNPHHIPGHIISYPHDTPLKPPTCLPRIPWHPAASADAKVAAASEAPAALHGLSPGRSHRPGRPGKKGGFDQGWPGDLPRKTEVLY